MIFFERFVKIFIFAHMYVLNTIFNKSSNSWFSNFWLSDEVQNELPNRNFLCEIM